AATRFPYAGSEEFASMKMPRQQFALLVPQAAAKMDAYRQHLQQVQAEIKKVEEVARRDQANKSLQGKLNALRDEERVLHRFGSRREGRVAYAVRDGRPLGVHIPLRGDPGKPGPVAPRRVPKSLEGQPVAFPADGSGRLELARWLTRPDHP